MSSKKGDVGKALRRGASEPASGDGEVDAPLAPAAKGEAFQKGEVNRILFGCDYVVGVYRPTASYLPFREMALEAESQAVDLGSTKCAV